MDDTISRRAAIELADKLKDNSTNNERIADAVVAHNVGILEYQTALSLLPSIQLDHKCGRWEHKRVDYERYNVYGTCSECKERSRINNFCPYCGADMRGE